MFTGLIQQLGEVAGRTKDTLEVRSRLAGLRRGDSVAVNGACLTVTRRAGGRLSFDVSPETWRRTNLGALKTGSPVNLEPSLRAGDPLGGHLVSGHVDARSLVLERQSQAGGFVRMRFSLPPALRGLAALKGSIAVDGVSLTVTAVKRAWFETVLVPHTLHNTTLGARKAGESVNLEADMLARYVRSALDVISPQALTRAARQSHGPEARKETAMERPGALRRRGFRSAKTLKNNIAI